MKKGAYTALITPFKDGDLDIESFKKIVQYQVDSDISGILIGGTTGESPHLSIDELEKMVYTAKDICLNNTEIMLGIGKNITKKVIELEKVVNDWPVDSFLVVTPYYNKPSQSGLIKHFSMIADNSNKPVVLYNVPGRTSCNISPETVYTLSRHENICAIKEASGNIDQLSMILTLCSPDFYIYSGDDSLTLPMLSLGASGVISVASNIIPSQIQELVKSYLSGNINKSKELHLKLFSFMKTMFIDTNPIPVKYAAYRLGLCPLEYILPLCEPSEKDKETILQEIKKLGLLDA